MNEFKVHVLENMFGEDEIQTFLTNEIVLKNYELLNNENKITFSLPLNDSMKQQILKVFSLELDEIPMTWSNEDVSEHIDVSSKNEIFENTYVYYLTDSNGKFIIDGEKYDIRTNVGYIFNEGMTHKTEGAGVRLFIGPMNEHGNRVGTPTLSITSITPNFGPTSGGNNVTLIGTGFQSSDYNYLVDPNRTLVSISVIFTYSISTNVGPVEGAAGKINVTGSINDEIMIIPIASLAQWIPQNNTVIGVNNFILYSFVTLTYETGLPDDNNFFSNLLNYTYVPPYPCFKEGSKILTSQGYKLIQDLKKGDLVKTLNDYKAIELIGKRDIQHNACKERIKDQLYVCSTENYEVWEDLVLTGCHSLLVDDFKDQEREKSIEVNGGIYVTENKYRLPACVDERAMVYEIPGTYTIYHIALENDDYYMNYGIYANGLLVESCSKRYLKELSNIILI